MPTPQANLWRQILRRLRADPKLATYYDMEKLSTWVAGL